MKNLDQFYTNPKLAKKYVDFLLNKYRLKKMDVVEPSAGTGAFVNPLREQGVTVSAMDLEPKAPGIKKGNFLVGKLEVGERPVAVIGNPPFGRQSNMAVRFFNRAAENNASLIAFIVPRTFRKISIQDKLDKNFWLIHDSDVPGRAFIRNGTPHDVPCAWQVWKRQEKKRPEVPTPDVSGIIRYVSVAAADFALRRVGGRAGIVLPLDNGEKYSPSSTFFIHAVRHDAAKLLSSIDWSDIRNSTAGVRSISKREIALELTKVA